MGIRWVVGATNKKDKEKSGHEAQDNANYQRHGGQSGGNDGGQGGNPGGVRNYYPPMETRPMPQYTGGGSGGNGAMNVGYYAGGSPGDPMSYGGAPMESRQMGFITDPYETESRHRSRRTGRFVRGEGDEEVMAHSGRRHQRDEGMESGWGEERNEDGMRELKRKIRKLEEKLEDADSGREVKRLKDRIEELEEKLDGMKREKRGGEKKRKSGGDREDGDGDDGEDDPARILEKILGGKEVTGKEFLMELPRLFQESVEVIKNPPSTWPPYLEKRDYAGIYAMESKELAQALEGFKSGQKKLKDVAKELKHTCAALIQLDCHRLHEDK